MYSSSYTSHAARNLALRHRDTFVRYNSYPQLAVSYENKDQLIEQVHTTFPWCHVDKVCNVYAAHMYGMYLLRKEEMQLETGANCEMTLYHVTTEQRAVESLEHGLDWRRTKRSRFGRGVSFSDDADYADYFADNKSGEVKRVIIVCTVLVSKTSAKMVKPNSGLSIPPGLADTTMSPNGRVYVKYNDYEFYPLYFVYYQRRLEDIPKSRYFNKNHKNNFNKGQLLPVTADQQQEQLWRQQQQNEMQRRQEQKNEMQRRQQEQKELLRRQNQKHYDLLRQQRQQWQEQQRNDWCLIL